MTTQEYAETHLLSELATVRRFKQSAYELLTDYEAALIYWYSADGHSVVNNLLRTSLTEASEPPVSLLLDALSKLATYQGMVYRGVNLTSTELDRYERACGMKETIAEPFFVSASRNRLIANKFGSTQFRIISRRGRDIATLSKHEREEEVLFLCGSRFYVTKFDKQHDGSIVITLKESE